MNKLYWKIFTAFWLVSTVFVLLTGWLTYEYLKQTSVVIQRETFVNTTAKAAVSILRMGGDQALREWLAEINDQSRFNASLIRQLTGEPVLHDSEIKFPEQLFYRTPKQIAEDKRKMFGPNKVVSKIINPLNLVGSGYQLVIYGDVPFATAAEFLTWKVGGLVLLMLISLGLICYWLSWYIARPLTILQRLVKQFAKGDFKAKVGQKISPHQGGVYQLARQYDRMVDKIQVLMTSQTQLLQDLSHELRSPIARLQVALELARSKSKSDINMELDKILKESERLNDLIGKILSLFSLQSRQYKLVEEELDLLRLIDVVKGDICFQYELKAKQIQINAPSKGYQIKGDSALMASVFENIFKNSIVQVGGDDLLITVNLSMLVADNDKKILQIDVADNGPGVDEMALAHLFDPFYQSQEGKKLDKSGVKGYGLGLAIVDNIIGLHGGSVLAQNDAGAGLLIKIQLPAAK